MNILFLTMNIFTDIEMHNIYSDLMKEFIAHGHRPYIVTPREKKSGERTELIDYEMYSLLKVRIGNNSDVSLVEKGISTVLLSIQYLNAIKKYFGKLKFGLILYSTPPITLANPVRKLKKYFKCRTYLMLKDIFPQNAVDLGMFDKKSMIYRYFRYQEKMLYQISDGIGCMSEANVKYILRNNPEIKSHKVQICPNSIDPVDKSVNSEERKKIRMKYGIPQDKLVFVYGGNLGKPQGIDFMLKCLHSQKSNDKVFFLIVGNGTEYGRIERYIEKYHLENIALRQWIPKEEYDKVIAACDVGMIFLDHRFTIPNFPSRLLGYMSVKLPVLAVTDRVTDIGKVIVDGGFGWWCESDRVCNFEKIIQLIVCTKSQNIPEEMKEKSFKILCDFYHTKNTYTAIKMN